MSTRLEVRRPAAATTSTFRPDIQGLRAIAVIVVILDHLFGWPAGGFVGVDVFFVVSGYLITSLMLREHQQTGRISWGGFYRRRIKRIIPASTVTLGGTLLAAYLLYRAARFQQVAGDALWSLLFASNWHFAATGTDYLTGNAPPSPLQHFWSLSLEEQFYFLWPIILIAALGVIGRQLRVRGRSANRFLGALVATIAVGSFVWAMVETANNPTWAYFSTFSRAWELAAGALLAVAGGKLAKIPASVRPFLSYLGLAGIGASLFLITTTSSFPGPWAALPVVAAALVIASGVGRTPALTWPLTNRVSVYIGTISYSLYLWHFPVIVLLASVIPRGSADYYLWAIAGMTVLSVASYHLIENPARHSRWLEPGDGGGSLRGRSVSIWRNVGYWFLGVWAAGTLVLVLLASQVATVDVVALNTTTSPAPVDTQATPAQAQLTGEINTALAATSWPDLTPSLDALGRPAMAPEWMEDGCLGGEQAAHPDPQENTERCVYGDAAATKTAVLLGDSVAISYLPGIRAALVPNGWRIKVLTLVQCPVSELPVLSTDGALDTGCDTFRQWAIDQVKSSHPDLVVISESPNTLRRLPGEPAFGVALSQWSTGMQSSLSKLAGNAGRIVMLAAPPGTGTRDLEKCSGALSTPADCVSDPGGQWHQLVQAGSTAAATAGISYVNTEPWFCSANRCPAFASATTFFADPAHITSAYSQHLGPVLGDVLNN